MTREEKLMQVSCALIASGYYNGLHRNFDESVQQYYKRETRCLANDALYILACLEENLGIID